MQEQDKKPDAGWPKAFPQADAAALKDDCFTLPEEGTARWKSLEERCKRFDERLAAGSIPQYECFKPPGK